MEKTCSDFTVPNQYGLRLFDEISLNEMNEVKLLSRFDSKYCLPVTQLRIILEEIYNNYFVLKIENTIVQSYSSVYFDTPGNQFYLAHHNGKAERFKIRKRSYINSEISFTEIKCKSNKGKTSKKRIPAFSESNKITASEKHFIADMLNLNSDNLKVKSSNTFNRITLVSKNFDERCTIDLNITFERAGKSLVLSDFVVIELKQGTLNMKSKLADSLKKHRIYPMGFSKYCMGRALTEENLKKNRFKSKILKIQKEFKLETSNNQLMPEPSLTF